MHAGKVPPPPPQPTEMPAGLGRIADGLCTGLCTGDFRKRHQLLEELRRPAYWRDQRPNRWAPVGSREQPVPSTKTSRTDGAYERLALIEEERRLAKERAREAAEAAQQAARAAQQAARAAQQAEHARLSALAKLAELPKPQLLPARLEAFVDRFVDEARHREVERRG